MRAGALWCGFLMQSAGAAREALRIWHQSLGRLELLMRAGGNRNSQLISRAAETSEHLRRRVLLYYSKMQIHVRTTRGRAKRKCVSAFNHFAHTQIYFNSIWPDERVSPCVFLSRRLGYGGNSRFSLSLFHAIPRRSLFPVLYSPPGEFLI